MSHNISLPRHRYVWVVPSFVLRSFDEHLAFPLMPAVWIGVSVTPGRSLGCHVLLENGAMVVDLPLHALRGAPVRWEPLDLSELVAWDCYGWSAEAWEPSYLSGLACTILSANHKEMVEQGTLWFCLDHVGDGFSLAPDQHKHLWVVERERDHALMLLPQDRVLVEERSFTEILGIPPIKRQSVIWSAE
jgi:hypothetical protein